MACPSRESVMNSVCYNQSNPMQDCPSQVYGRQNPQNYTIGPHSFFSSHISPPAPLKPLSENMSQESGNQTEHKPHVCKICSESFSRSEELTQHQSMCRGSKDFKCEFCPEKFSSSSDLTEHRHVHSADKSFTCDACPKPFSQSIHLAQHKSSQEEENSYSLSSNSFSPPNSSNVPIPSSHAEGRPHKCLICPKSFMLISDLEKHQRVHSGKECKLYTNFANNPPGMHGRTHNSSKPFKCAVCSKCFANGADLGKHVMVHNGEKPFKCNVCPKSYTRVDHLTRHQMVHTGEKPHKCDVCLKCFCRKDHLAKHKRTHTVDHSM